MKRLYRTIIIILAGIVVCGCATLPGGSNGILLKNSAGYDKDNPTTFGRMDPPEWINNPSSKETPNTLYFVGICDESGKSDWPTGVYTRDAVYSIALSNASRNVSMFLRSNVDMQFESANRDMVQNGKADTYSRVQEDISLGSEVVFSGLKIEDVYTEDREKTVRINRRNVSATYTIHYILYVISRADIEDAQNSLNRMDEQTRELAAYQELVETFNDAHLFLKDCDFENAEILYRRAYTTVIGTLAQLEALKTFTDSGFTITDDLRNGYNNTIKEVKSVLENYDPSKPDQIIIRRLQEERDILERQLLAETAELNERLRTETTELRNQLAESAGAVRALNVQYENLYAVLRNLQNNQMAQGDVVSENLLREWVSLLSPAALRNAEQYRVKRGDYLAKIAREKYGSAFYWPIIYAANSSALNLRNPNSLPINVTLRLPALPLDFEERSLMAASDR